MVVLAGSYGTSQLPLAGAILCCTSIPPEQRTELASIGAQMGATIKLDLTSDVTHLIVGNISSAKYRYVAKAREDVKVLMPEWLEALRSVWMEGDDVDVAALEKEYRLPTFYGLKICLTGFDNPDQRKYIQDMAVQNGAEYHGDLTKNVTHLIAAIPSGKKYEHAVNWRMKIVAWEWFEQSLERGMTLDEDYYHPTKPVEERGYGAWDRRRSTSPTLGKRSREAEQTTLVNPRQRKLRRSASSRMGSQSQALWAGITAGGLDRKLKEDDDWTDGAYVKGLPRPDTPATDNLDEHVQALPQDDAPPEDPASHGFGGTSANDNGIFRGRVVFTHGFESDKTKILRDHLEANGATVIRQPAELYAVSSDDLTSGFLVVPHDAVKPDLTSLPGGAGAMVLVTNWWVELCLHTKILVDPTEHVLCRPFDKLSISGFDGLIINSTAFAGIELLLVTRVVALMGGTYDEYLTTKTSVIVCNTRRPSPEKFRFATDKRIPAVHATWLWDCVTAGQVQPYEKYLLNKISPVEKKPRGKPRGPFEDSDEEPTAPLPEEESFKLRNKNSKDSKAQKPKVRNVPSRPGELSLAISADPTPASTKASTTHPNTTAGDLVLDNDDSFLVGLDGSTSLPLQDIHPAVNSPRRPSSDVSSTFSKPSGKSNTSTSSNALKAAPATRKVNDAVRQPTPDSVIPPLTEPVAEDTPQVHNQDQDQDQPQAQIAEQKQKDYTNIMTALLARRKASASKTPDPQQSRQNRRRRLGRAPTTTSNPSTAGDGQPLSRASSVSATVEATEEPDGGFDSVLGPGEREFGRAKAVEVYQPSQELGWDAGGDVEKKVESRGVVKDVVSGESGFGGMGMGGRTRRKREKGF